MARSDANHCVCEKCGLRFQSPPSQNRKYCSRKCQPALTKPLKIEGNRFGKLVAIKPTNERKDRGIVWEFRCDCGETIKTTAKLAKGGNTRSCGCLIKESAHAKSISNGSRLEKHCDVCGSVLYRKASSCNSQKYYCSVGGYRSNTNKYTAFFIPT